MQNYEAFRVFRDASLHFRRCCTILGDREGHDMHLGDREGRIKRFLGDCEGHDIHLGDREGRPYGFKIPSKSAGE